MFAGKHLCWSLFLIAVLLKTPFLELRLKEVNYFRKENAPFHRRLIRS